MIKLMKKAIQGVALGAMLLGFATLGGATTFDGFVVPGVLNTFEDTSREAFVDSGDGNVGEFGVGDVLVGFVRVENRSDPSSLDLGNTTYVIFSQQVKSINTTTGLVEFEATTVSGLTLPELVPGASTGSMLAVVTMPGTDGFGNLIDTAPSGASSLADYLAALTATGFTLEFTAGIVDTTPDFIGGTGDFFNATIDPAGALAGCGIGLGDPLVVTTDCIQNLTVKIADFTAGLSIIDNNTSLVFDELLAAGNGGATMAQVGIIGGNASGARDTSPAEFKSIAGLADLPQCGADGTVACGFRDNADFQILPRVVPEPASMLLFGIGLLGVGIYGRKRSRKSE